MRMKKSIFCVLFFVVCLTAFATPDSLYNAATIGQATRNQKAAKGLQVGAVGSTDSLQANGYALFSKSVGIGGGLASSAILNLTSTSKGFKMPGGTTAQMLGISSPVNGLLFFNTDSNKFYYAISNSWYQMGVNGSVDAWSLTGNSGTNSATNFIGNTDAKNFVIKTRNLERFCIDSLGNISSSLNIDSFSFLLGNPFSGKFFLYGGKPAFGIANSFIARGMNLVNIQSNGNIELEADSSSVNANDINNSSTINSLYHSDSSMIINSSKDAGISVVYEDGRPSPGFYAFTAETGNVIANMYLQNYHGNGVRGKDQKRFQCDSYGVGFIQWQDNLDSAGHDQFGTWATDGTSQIFTGVPYENQASDTTGIGSDRLILFHGNRLAYKISGIDKFSVDTLGLVSYAELDSATIYALTPTKNATVYCSNCTGNGIVGRILSYIGAAWRRLSFN